MFYYIMELGGNARGSFARGIQKEGPSGAGVTLAEGDGQVRWYRYAKRDTEGPRYGGAVSLRMGWLNLRSRIPRPVSCC